MPPTTPPSPAPPSSPCSPGCRPDRCAAAAYPSVGQGRTAVEADLASGRGRVAGRERRRAAVARRTGTRGRRRPPPTSTRTMTSAPSAFISTKNPRRGHNLGMSECSTTRRPSLRMSSRLRRRGTHDDDGGGHGRRGQRCWWPRQETLALLKIWSEAPSCNCLSSAWTLSSSSSYSGALHPDLRSPNYKDVDRLFRRLRRAKGWLTSPLLFRSSCELHLAYRRFSFFDLSVCHVHAICSTKCL